MQYVSRAMSRASRSPLHDGRKDPGLIRLNEAERGLDDSDLEWASGECLESLAPSPGGVPIFNSNKWLKLCWTLSSSVISIYARVMSHDKLHVMQGPTVGHSQSPQDQEQTCPILPSDLCSWYLLSHPSVYVCRGCDTSPSVGSYPIMAGQNRRFLGAVIRNP